MKIDAGVGVIEYLLTKQRCIHTYIHTYIHTDRQTNTHTH